MLSFILNSKTVKLSKFYLTFICTDENVWLILSNDFSSRRDKSKASMRSLEIEEELLPSCMRIRTGISSKTLAFRFQITKGSC